MENKKVLILGATSAIAQESAKIYAQNGCPLYLAARNEQRLNMIKNDLLSKYPETIIKTEQFSSDQVYDKGEELINNADKALKGIDYVIIAYGYLGIQKEVEQEPKKAVEIFDINFTSVAYLCLLLSNYFKPKGKGTICVISSVAGDKGRAGIYIYGAAKAGLSAFLQGLRQRLFKYGINVLTIKPGFVSTPMTAHLKQGILFAKADKVGLGIVRAIEKKKDVVYLPYYWRYILLIIKLIPECLFKQLKI